MKTLKDIFLRMTSRKFLLTVASALILVANQEWAYLVVLISGYMGIEGVGDAAERVASQKTKQAELSIAAEAAKKQSDMMALPNAPADVDLSRVVPGIDPNADEEEAGGVYPL